ncbi:MAG: DUF4296 domain-containing protein [Bacteroidales bacterium]|nr:DUF4296 domain-containing protein [Bacteroidales bacterium]
MMSLTKRYLCVIGVALLFVLITSCSKKKEQIIPVDTMTQILKDIYMTTSLLETYEINRNYSSKDSITIYYELYDRYGYSVEDVENSLEYYFIHKNHKLIKMYNTLINEMTVEMVKKQTQPMNDSGYNNNLWPFDKTTYYFVGKTDGSRYADFDIQMNQKGMYVVSFDISVSATDKTMNPSMEIWRTDVVDGGKGVDTTLVANVKYVKDGRTHSFSIPVYKADYSLSNLFGSLYCSYGDPSTLKNATISNIKIEYKDSDVVEPSQDIFTDITIDDESSGIRERNDIRALRDRRNQK